MATVELNSNANLQIVGDNNVKIGPHTAVPVPPSFTGNIFAWGDNSYGKLGSTEDGAFASPIHVSTNISSWARLSSSSNAQNFAAVKTDGTLHIWGRNNHGQLGNNQQGSYGVGYSSPVQLGTGTDWDKVSTSYNKTIASKTDGSLWAWGFNYPYGELGNNNIYHVSSPVMIMTAGNTWSQISSGYDHTLAIRSDGKLYCWGRNSYGQLGIGSTNGVSSPVQLGTSTNWSKVAAGAMVSLAIKTDGSLWSWGKNNSGQLGINNIAHRSSPVQVGISTDWTFIATSSQVSFGIRNGGQLYGWGSGSGSNLNPPYTNNVSSPIHVLTTQSWTHVYVGTAVTAAISGGQIWTWGTNFGEGQCGQNSLTGSNDPALIYNGDTDWVELAGGYLCFIARKS